MLLLWGSILKLLNLCLSHYNQCINFTPNIPYILNFKSPTSLAMRFRDSQICDVGLNAATGSSKQLNPE